MKLLIFWNGVLIHDHPFRWKCFKKAFNPLFRTGTYDIFIKYGEKHYWINRHNKIVVEFLKVVFKGVISKKL